MFSNPIEWVFCLPGQLVSGLRLVHRTRQSSQCHTYAIVEVLVLRSDMADHQSHECLRK